MSERKFSVLALVMTLVGATANAAPQTLSYGGYLQTPDGQPVQGSLLVTFKLFDAMSGGNEVWQEQVAVDVATGYFSALLGTETPFSAQLFAGAPLFLELQIESDQPMTPRVAVTSVPHALEAAVANDVTGNIHPTSVSVGGSMVIDAAGNWVGSATGLTGAPGADGQPGPLGPMGPLGPIGPSGTSCWDLNDNGSCDAATEDINVDLACDVLDCVGAGYVFGPGLLLSGGTNLSVDFAGSGTSPNAARADHDHGTIYALQSHNHDASYPTLLELMTPGAINDPLNPVDWSQLKGVDPSLADGFDNDTDTLATLQVTCATGDVPSWDGISNWNCLPTPLPGQGLQLVGNTFNVVFGGNGAASDAARSDHDHPGVYLPLGSAMSCPPGEKVAALSTITGEPACLPDFDTLDTLACTGNQIPRWNSGWSCTDEVSYVAGNGLNLSTGIFDVQFGGSGSAMAAAHADHDHASAYAPFIHNHDGVYPTFTELADTSGDVNTGGPIDWTQLNGVPAAIADGDDKDLLKSMSCPPGDVPKTVGTNWECKPAVEPDTIGAPELKNDPLDCQHWTQNFGPSGGGFFGPTFGVPATHRITGGGCRIASGGADFLGSYPDANNIDWHCDFNCSGPPCNVDIYVVGCRLP